ncbi:protein KAKU4 [Amaranthus tricolor]|uniref:protein KAKU4 n=1 Tax=Amaranthus tricolor TaxID=29722 RepID=UPI00258F21BA|nr:protein KAKU4 [Amaranthus tricolor]
MATTSSRRTSGVGGKIVQNKRLPKTPYSRPSPPSPTPPLSDNVENPNWLSGLIYPAKVIASGAGKILSFFGNDDDDLSSSSDIDSSEYDDDDEEIDDDNVLSPSNKSDSKRAIEQLVIQETYSRKEANALIKLVTSRIDETNGTLGETTPNIRTTAIMEARKWLQEKRSSSKKKFEDELDVLNMASSSQISKNEKGSPVDMARSYMQNRPAWASSSLKQAEAGSLPVGVLNFQEETPKSTLRSSELKKSSFTSGSWNLLEEIRRVRSKATEELLASAPLTKTIISSFSPESKSLQDSLMNKGDVVGAGPAESTHDETETALQDAAVSTHPRISQDVGDAVQSVGQQESQAVAELKYDNNDQVKQFKSTTAENGFGRSAFGSAEGQSNTHDARPSEEENENLVESSQVGPDIDMENSNPPTDPVINGSQDTSSMHEEPSQEFRQPVANDGTATKVKDTQTERKSRGYTRRGRPRGK